MAGGWLASGSDRDRAAPRTREGASEKCYQLGGMKGSRNERYWKGGGGRMRNDNLYSRPL